VDEQANHIKTPKQLRIGSAIFYFISGFGFATWASRIPTIKQQLHLNDAQLGTVLFAIPIGLMCTMPLTNWLLSKYSSRNIMLFGSVFLCIVLSFIGLSNNTVQLMIALFFFGCARNLQTLSINTQAVAVQALYSKSIMATFHGIWSMAGFSGAAVGLAMVYFNVAPGYHLVIVSISLILCTLYFIKYTLNIKPVKQARKPVFSLPDKYLMKFSLICFASMACENTMYDWSALYFQKEVNPDKTLSTAAFVIYLVAMTSGRLFGDRLVTKIGIKAVLKFSGVLIFCGLLLAVALPFMVTVLPGFIMVGFGVSCVVPMIFSLAGKSKTMSSSSALAAISTIGYLGFVIVPPFVGYVAQAASLRLSFGVIALLGGVIIYLVSKINDEQEQAEPVAPALIDN
jgi:MFS family permease